MEPLIKGTTSLFQSLASEASKSSIKLRLRAAAVLTSSLQPSQRDELFNAIGAIDSQTAEERTRASVGEAVAEAVTKEAEFGKVKLSEAVRIAEAAAKARVEAELKLLRQKDAKENAHPILGQQLIDLGYKQIYVAKALDLASIPVWERQRAYRHDRAKEIVKEKVKNKHVGLPGVIALHEDDDGKLTIIDGQHRVGMMALMEKKQPTDVGFDLDKILVEVFPNKESPNKSFAEDVFIDINKAEPIKLVDMPGIATGKERKIITDTVNELQEQYPDMFKMSQRCRPPHVNSDNLRDALFSSEVLKRHLIENDKALLGWIYEKNEEIEAKFEKGDAPTGINERALDKAKKFRFFLGLDSSWLYQ